MTTDKSNATVEAEPSAPANPVTAALKEAQAQAEARKAIAEARSGTAKALLPTLPTEVPAAALDVSGAGSTFGTVNAYRAALSASEGIAAEVVRVVGDRPIWLIAGSNARSPFAVMATVRNALDQLSTRLREASGDLTAPLEGESPPAPTPQVEPSEQHEAKTLGGVELLVGAISSALPLVLSLLSTPVTVRGADTELDDDAVVNLMGGALLALGKRVVRPDPSAELEPGLARKLHEVRTLAAGLRQQVTQVVEMAKAEDAALAPLRREDAVRGERFTALLKKDNPPNIDAEITAIVDVAKKIAGHERRKAVIEARLADAQALLETAEQALDALYAVGDDGFSPLANSSFAARLGSEWVQLEVDDASAGSESDYHDKKIVHDYAIHTGSATITYRAIDAHGVVLGAGTHVRTASCRVNLKEGTISWAT